MRLWWALCGLLCASNVALAAADPVLNEAHAAWKARDGNRLAQIAAQGRNHVLAPYFEYWQIDLAPSDEPIRRYLARYPKTLLAERLRADWIRGLGRRGDWALIASEARELEPRADDVQCWSLRARWERGDKSAADAILADWSTSREFFEPCIPLAESLVRAGRVSSADVWMRARRLAEGGQYGGARRVLRWLPANQAPSLKLLDTALGTPDEMLARGLYDARNAIDREMVAFALVRIGNDDPDRAARYMTRRIGSLSAEQRSWVNGQLGLVGARKLHPAALEWFRGSGQARLTDEHYGWWVRMAARDAAWSDVGLAIELMSPSTRRTPIWQYWLGRSFAERGQANAAHEAFGFSAANTGFYGILAADELGGRTMPPAPARAATVAE
ncbi:MAG: hypothetical protein ABIU95_15845, partial [Burkholderiales bacterium]